jgi:hypothetical protein
VVSDKKSEGETRGGFPLSRGARRRGRNKGRIPVLQEWFSTTRRLGISDVE